LLIVSSARKLGQIALDLLYPPRCVGCGQGGSLYCEACRATLSYLKPPVCKVCGLPVEQGRICPQSLQHPLHVDGIRSVATYEDSLGEAIRRFKYGYMRDLAPVLGDLLVAFWHANPIPVDVIVPVPLHRRRLRERGYNQSALLAIHLGRAVGLPVLCDALQRNRHTMSQVHLGWRERRENVANAFSCVDQRLAARRVLLVDDVCTTGSTLEACGVALRAGGARSVHALTVARARFA
jgi:ComF family protein